MKVDGGFGYAPDSLDAARRAAREAEQVGYDGLWSSETNHDPFLPLVVAADATEQVQLGTNIMVAFARSPMTVASTAWDLQAISQGRLLLGMGSQIKAHITKRFSMPWSHPAARMREYILALHAIWDSWQDTSKLDFQGDFYTHTLMTPFFDPGPLPYGKPKVYLAGVGELMTEVAGEVADGFLAHAFTTERYLHERTIPALQRGLDASGRTRADLEISIPAFVVTGTTEEEMAKSRTGTKEQIAFYASTPAYRPVLELHGWGDLQTELNGLSKQGKWKEMGTRIDDEVLDAFAVIAEPDQLAAGIRARFSGAIDRLSFYAPYRHDRETWLPVIEALKKA